MRDSIFYSAIRSLFVAFCAVIGICLAFIVLTIGIGALSSTSTDSKLKTVHTEEIMPNAEGQRVVLTSTAPVILQLNMDGLIGTEELSMKSIKQQLIESREGEYKDNRVKGILVHLNTPGGTVIDADGIYRALKEYKEKYKVPIYAYVDGLCASGGMYVAAAADKILASDVSLIGSIGVIAPSFLNFTKVMDKIGIEALTLSAGTDKDAMNPLRPWKPGEEKNYQDIVNYYYQYFLNVVTSNRPGLSKEKLINDYGARIFVAKEAMEYGFIDENKTSITEAIKELVKAAGIEENYQVIKFQKSGWWNTLFGDTAASLSQLLLKGSITHKIQLAPELDPALQNKFLYLYAP